MPNHALGLPGTHPSGSLCHVDTLVGQRLRLDPCNVPVQKITIRPDIERVRFANALRKGGYRADRALRNFQKDLS